MQVVIFGGTGMVGRGALRACLLDAGVRQVVTVGRAAAAEPHPKLQAVQHADLTDCSAICCMARVGFAQRVLDSRAIEACLPKAQRSDSTVAA